MNQVFKYRLFSILIIIILSMHCSTDQPIAEIDSISISIHDYIDYLNKKNIKSDSSDTAEKQLRYLNQLIDEHIISLCDFNDMPDQSNRQIPEKDLQKYYLNNKSSYIQKMKTEIDIICVKDFDVAQSIAFQAEDISFKKLKKRYHNHKLDLCCLEDLGFIDEDEHGIIGQLATQMEIDETSRPIEMQGYYLVFKSIDRFPERQLAFKEVVSQLKEDYLSDIWNSERLSELNKYKLKSNIKIYKSRFFAQLMEHRMLSEEEQ